MAKKVEVLDGAKGAWEQYGGGRRPIVNSYSRLEAGVYYLWESNSGTIFEPSNQFIDPVIDLPGLPNTFILEEIDKFWKNEAVYAEYGFIDKRGILLYGPPGNGKTAVIADMILILKQKTANDITVRRFSVASPAIQNLKKIEP